MSIFFQIAIGFTAITAIACLASPSRRAATSIILLAMLILVPRIVSVKPELETILGIFLSVFDGAVLYSAIRSLRKSPRKKNVRGLGVSMTQIGSRNSTQIVTGVGMQYDGVFFRAVNSKIEVTGDLTGMTIPLQELDGVLFGVKNGELYYG